MTRSRRSAWGASPVLDEAPGAHPGRQPGINSPGGHTIRKNAHFPTHPLPRGRMWRTFAHNRAFEHERSCSGLCEGADMDATTRATDLPRQQALAARTLHLAVAVAMVAAPLLGAAPASAGTGAGASAAADATGSAHTVTYDHYSFMVDGKRTYLWSGEFHAY